MGFFAVLSNWSINRHKERTTFWNGTIIGNKIKLQIHVLTFQDTDLQDYIYIYTVVSWPRVWDVNFVNLFICHTGIFLKLILFPEHPFNLLLFWIRCCKRNPYLLIFYCTALKEISPVMVQINMIFLTPLLFLFSSRGANYLTQILLRPGASDLTGSFR